ncbi:TusA-related sulfurtransferase [Mesocricetibacter intestinalis]|uniref:TusA-related sulfurtransferase n=1 Tax=Mesocricetibacter intestinalis TaxID=1521930 RepID=A0A4V3DA23_9PAST|nr:sulfurtransferase TusA family protein [Mesocricetibacter intestinalis]TDQ59773.1 TusA-related sulfurtransferase [Mesocricetibacter intestinalis]
MQYQLDVREYRCPLPLLMITKALARLGVDDELNVLVDAADVREDIRLWCRENHYVLSDEKSTGRLKICKDRR